MDISQYANYAIKNPAYVIGGGVDDGIQETTSGSSKRKTRNHWWQFWRPRA